MLRPLRLLTAFALFALVAVPACGADPAFVAPLRDGKVECEIIGELCHEPGQAYCGFFEECHDIGHSGDGERCLQVYEECKTRCEDAAASLGGAGGEGNAHVPPVDACEPSHGGGSGGSGGSSGTGDSGAGGALDSGNRAGQGGAR